MTLPLFQYQDEAAWVLAPKDRFGEHDEMGIGKTATVIGGINRSLGSRGMIIAPAMLRQNWLREFQRFSTYPLRIIKAQNIHDFIAWKRGRFDTIICSYEHATAWAQMMHDEVEFLDFIHMDEAHYLKNENSQRSQAILGSFENGTEGITAYAERSWHITGTPMANDPLDIYTFLRHCRAVDTLNSAAFVKHFFEKRMTTYGARHMVKDHMVDVLRQLLDNNRISRTHQDVGLQLPPIWMKELILEGSTIEIDKLIAMYPHVEQIIIEAIETNNLKLLDAFDYIATIRRLVGKAKAVPYANMLKLELDGGSRKRVAFFCHTEPLLAVRAQLQKYGYTAVVAYGDTPEKERQEAVRSFMEDENVHVFLGNMKVAGVGLTLTASSEIDVVESDWSPSNNAQAIKRVHRYGQTQDVHARFITLANSIDEAVNRVVAGKTAAIAQVEGREAA